MIFFVNKGERSKNVNKPSQNPANNRFWDFSLELTDNIPVTVDL